MNSKIKSILYILIVFVFVAISNYLVVKPLLGKVKEENIINNKQTAPTILEKNVEKQVMLYSKMTLAADNVNNNSQEWYQVNLRSDAIVKFQYYKKKNDEYKLNIKINDNVIENDEEFYEYDKLKLNFHLYGDILVIEHERSYNHISYVKIIDLASGLTRNLPALEDFYINNTIIDEYGLTAEYSRFTSKIDTYINNNETMLTLRVGDNNVSMNVCNKNTWPKDLINLDYVAFDINYQFSDDIIDFDKPDITNFKKLEDYIKIYKQEFNEICKNNN